MIQKLFFFVVLNKNNYLRDEVKNKIISNIKKLLSPKHIPKKFFLFWRYLKQKVGKLSNY